MLIIDMVCNARRGRSMKVIYAVNSDGLDEDDSHQFDIPGLAEVDMKFESKRKRDTLQVFIQFKKESPKKEFIAKINVTCKDSNFSKQLDCPEHWTDYTDMGFVKPVNEDIISYVVDITLVTAQAMYKPAALRCEMLYDDRTHTDFHLSTEEGSIPVHRACLAAHSEVFKTMLSGEWKEATNGCLHLKGLQISLQTLRDLKEYMYLGTLREESLRTLLLIADCYKIGHLKEECVWQLASTVTADNLMGLLEFASDNKMADLIFAILQIIPDDIVNSLYSKEQHKEKMQVDKLSLEISISDFEGL